MDGMDAAVEDLPDPISADLLESDEAYLLVVDLPGATPDRTNVSTDDGVLRVRADREPELPPDAELLHDERPNELRFELPLPPDADATSARASLANGLLEVTIPRKTTGVSIPIGDG